MRVLTILLTILLLSFAVSCGFTRGDILLTASSSPDIEVRGDAKVLPSSSTFEYGFVNAYEPSRVRFTVANRGTLSLRVRDIFLDNETIDYMLDVSETDSLVSPGASTWFSVVFMPSIEAGISVDLVITSNDPDQPAYRITLNGTGVRSGLAEPDITLEQGRQEIFVNDTVSFGTVQAGSSETRPFTITNDSSSQADLTIFSVLPTRGDTTAFNVFANGADNLPPGSSSTFRISFLPTSNVPYSADIRIRSNDPDESEYVFTVTGTGELPVTALPDIEVMKGAVVVSEGAIGYSFPDTAIADTAVTTFTVKNPGLADLTVQNIRVIGGSTDFDIGGIFLPRLVVPGGSATFDVEFTPQSPGTRIDDIEITSDDPDESPLTFSVTGKGVNDLDVGAAVLYIEGVEYPPMSLFDFGKVAQGRAARVVILVRNVRKESLALRPPLIAGSKAYDSDMKDEEIQLDGGEVHTFDLIFTPVRPGSQSAKLFLRGEFAGSYSITLTGIGVD